MSHTNLIYKTPENTTQILKAVAMFPGETIAIIAIVKFPFEMV